MSLSGECGPNLAPCHAVWDIYLLLARIIKGVLDLIALLLLFQVLLSFRRHSGLFAEPLSIAGLATLLPTSPLLRMLQDIDSRVSNKQLTALLAGKRYGISEFTTNDGKVCHGILPTDQDSEAGVISVEVGKTSNNQSEYTAELPSPDYSNPIIESATPRGKSETWHAVLERLYYLFVFLFVGGLFALIAYYH